MKNILQQGKVDYDWGYEVAWASNESYTGKLLVFPKAGNATPFLQHKVRRKSLFVNAGQIKLKFIDVVTGVTREGILEEGKTADIAEMSPHSLEALVDNTVVFEVGSAHYGEDNFFLSPNNTAKT